MTVRTGTDATEYIWTIQVNTAPAAIDLAAALDGWEMPDRTRPFAFLEIGCGHGLTLAALAASYPAGRFVGLEPNPGHVASARALAAAAGLGNLEIIEATADQCLEAGLGPFDIVAMHGVYSWVPRDARADMVALCAETLAPGGRVYVSYNALPGQAPLARVRDLLLAEAEDEPDPLDRARGAAARLATRLDAGEPALMADAEVAATVAWLVRQDPRYIVHELMPDGWEALPFERVASDFQAAGFDFAGSLPLAHNFAELTVPPAQRARLGPAPNRVARETAKDALVGTRFRRDVLVRSGVTGTAGMSGLRPGRLAALSRRPFVLCVDPARAGDRIDLGTATIALDQRHKAIRTLLAGRPLDVPGAAAATGLPPAEILDILLLLAAAGQAGPMVERPRPPGSGPWRLTRANRALVAARLDSGEAVPLASPVTGMVFPVEPREARWLAALDDRNDRREPEDAAFEQAIAATLPWLASLGIVEGA